MGTVTSPRPPPLALKLVTLLFSGGVAALAIAHGGSLGCSPAPAASHVAPAPTSDARVGASAPADDETQTNEALATPTEPPVAKAPARASDDAPTPELAPRYLGGSKSDVDVWGVDGGAAGLLGRGEVVDDTMYIGGSKSGLMLIPRGRDASARRRADAHDSSSNSNSNDANDSNSSNANHAKGRE